MVADLLQLESVLTTFRGCYITQRALKSATFVEAAGSNEVPLRLIPDVSKKYVRR